MLRAFARHGAAVISSDEIVHWLLREEPRVKSAIVERFGDGVLDADGEIDRARVADLVFADPEELAWLENLLHPLVIACYFRWREQLAELESPPTVCATEVPLLYEVRADEHFDVVVAVTASPEVRMSRVVKPMIERAWRLLPDEEKLARADFRYVNDGTLAELDAFVSDVIAKLTARCSGP
jgi:dephospho-CoA kinase